MAKHSPADSPLWEEFQRAARRQRRDPVRMLTEFMRERLEAWEDARLDEEIGEDARRSGYREEDSVNLVRRHRRDRDRRAAS